MLRRLLESMTVWPSGLRRWLQAPVRKGVGSNPTAVTSCMLLKCMWKHAMSLAGLEPAIFGSEDQRLIH